MSHQIVITFDLDESRVQENAEKEAGRQIAKELMDKVFGQYYNRDATMRKYVQDAVAGILMSEKERIVSEAVKEVAGTLRRTKLAREKLQEALENGSE